MTRFAILAFPQHRRKDAFDFVQRLAHFLVGNVFTQALVAVTGLFLVRWLSIEQYAIYTIGVATTGAVSVLAQGGAGSGFVAILGRHWPDHERLAPTVVALQKVRRRIALFMLPAVLLLAGFLLYRNSAGLVSSSLVILALVIFWIGEMNSRTVDQVLFFDKQTSRVQRLDSLIAVVRFVLIYILFLAGGLTAASALMVVALLALFRILPIERWVHRLIPRATTLSDEADRREIMASVKHQLPSHTFLVLQAQIVILMLTLHANAAVIASYGALLRITALMGPVRQLNSAFCTPIVAKAKAHVPRTILLLTGVNALPGLALLLCVWFVPPAKFGLLWLLGPQYANLDHEIMVTVLTTTFSITGDAFWLLVASRGWVKRATLQIPLGLLWVVIGSYVLDLSTITGALLLNAGFTVPAVIVGVIEIVLNRRR